MSYTFLLESGEESSAASWGEMCVSAPSSWTRTVARSSSSGNGMESFPGFPSGTASSPSTVIHGLVGSGLSPEGSPAKTYQRPTREGKGWTAPNPACGYPSRKLLAKFDPRSCSWKTPRTLEIGELDEFSGTLAALGYVGQHGVLGGSAAGLDAEGERMWIVAASASLGRESLLGCLQEIDRGARGQGAATPTCPSTLAVRIARHEERCGQPAILGEPFRLAHRVERLRAVGNVQFPSLAELALSTLSRRLVG